MRSRNDRRRLRHEVGALSDNARRVRAELFACEAHLAEANRIAVLNNEARASSDSLRADVLRGIEAYVDALGKLVDVDDKLVSPVLQDDEPFHDLLVSHRWRGVATAEQAKEELTQEVAHRSVGKSDLALLLSSVDQTAFRLCGALPEAFKGLRGERFVEEVVHSLAHEEFTKTLMGDPRWAEMRRRWVRLGWRVTTDETFNAAFVRAAAERAGEIHGGREIRDTILDERIQKEPRAVRDQMIEAFRIRLEREYDALLGRAASPGDVGVDVTLSAAEAEQLDAVADRWDTSRNGAMDRIVREAVVQHLPPPGDDKIGTQDRKPLPYSDHAMMRAGRTLWDVSYKLGWTDEQTRDRMVTAAARESDQWPGHRLWPDHLMTFAAKWAVHAFQRLMTSHTFAAALMCSDVQREAIDGIEEQWDAFLVIVPNGMLVAGEFEFSRVLVATYSFGAQMILLTTGGSSLVLPEPRTIVSDSPTLADLLVSDEADLAAESTTQRCLVMAKRLVAGLLLNMQDAGTHKIREVAARPKSKNREAEPEHRIVTVGQPIEIDCRDAVREYVERGTRSSERGHRRHGMPTVQWMVRGHFRMQAHGPRHALRRKTWIRPHWHGNEAALIQTRPSKVVP